VVEHLLSPVLKLSVNEEKLEVTLEQREARREIQLFLKLH